jgi:hypothetical protein
MVSRPGFFFNLFTFTARLNQYFNARKRSGIPDQKGVLEMIRGLPENYLFPGNNKVWHGIVAWHFCLILIVQMWGSATKRKTGQDFFCHHHENQRDGSDAMPMILLHITRVHKGEGIHHYEKKKDSCL